MGRLELRHSILFLWLALDKLQGVLLVFREGTKRLVVAALRGVGRLEWSVVIHERRSLLARFSLGVGSIFSDNSLS